MKNIIIKTFQLFLLPLTIALTFYIWSLPRITTDYNFNTDELIYLDRTKYAQAYFSGDFSNPIWSEWGAYDQPQLTNYLYALVPGDRTPLLDTNSPCPDKRTGAFYDTWSCLSGPPISTWDSSISPLKKLVVDARTLATGVSSLAIASTYYLGFMVAGPISGLLAAMLLGYYSFFKNLSTMVMMDQLLLILLNLQFICVLALSKRKPRSLPLFLFLGVVTGLALSTKLSALIPTAISYIYLSVSSFYFKRKSLKNICISIILAASIFVTLHPPLWNNPVEGIQKMLSWRLGQIQTQSNIEYIPLSLGDKVTYSLDEIFTSWNKTNQPTLVYSLLIAGLVAFIATAKSNSTFAIIGLLNILAFLAILPIKWNRYLLPIMPTVAVLFASIPSMLYGYISQMKINYHQIKNFTYGIISAGILLIALYLLQPTSLINTVILVITLFLTLQGYFITRSMLYAFSHRQSPVLKTEPARHSFTLIIPAKKEAAVIGQTISSVSALNYPKNLYEVLVIVKADDTETISVAQETIQRIKADNIRLVEIDGDAYSKAYSLNIGLQMAKHNYIGIFDAEDEPNQEILQKVNEYLLAHPTTHAVQAPVHLTNIQSTWYSGLNAVEYYFWFRSVLPFLEKNNTVPLGGNTIFIHKDTLKSIGGYDETCLTEDAELGIHLSSIGANIGIIDDPIYATKEETPSDEIGLIRQRSRWDQGYLQVLSKGSWKGLPLKQQLLTVYILTQPIFRHLSFLNMIFSPLLASFGAIPTGIALLSFVPGYFLLIQLSLYCLGLADLSKQHKIKLSTWRYVLMIIAFIPYQALLSISTLRAITKIMRGNYAWDKTKHGNSHRQSLAILEK